MTRRDPAIDLVRAIAMVGVVLGHWMVTALVIGPANGLAVHSPLQYLGQLVPLTWLLQTLGLFFFCCWQPCRSSGASNTCSGGTRFSYRCSLWWLAT